MLTILAYLAEILPIVFYLIFLKRNRGEGLWVIFLYCILSALTELIFAVTTQPIVFSSFAVLQFLLISYFFYSSLQDKKLKLIPILGVLVFCVFAGLNISNKNFDSMSESLASIVFIIYCILLLYEQIKDTSTVFVYYNKKFWVVIAFFLYFSATFFLYIYFSTLSDQQRHTYWVINNFFEILKNILFSVSFIMKKYVNKPVDMEFIDN